MPAVFPALPSDAWADTLATLHRWTQIVGKVRLAHTPWFNHSWHVPLYLTARGLTTSPIPHERATFQMDFDFLDHALVTRIDDGRIHRILLEPMSVATFWERVTGMLADHGLDGAIHPAPNEIADAVPFPNDHTNASYNPDHAAAFWRATLAADRVFKRFQTSFLGKQSPSHFFWGSFDLAVTRFSGRTAPVHPGGFPALPDDVTREAYSHEVASAGFWPGNAEAGPMFFAYAYPTPDGFKDAAVEPAGVEWSDALGEFVLPYDAVRTNPNPEAALLAFLTSSYEAAAALAGWDRGGLECAPGVPRTPRVVTP